MPISDQPVLYVVACGGRPTADLPQFIKEMQKSSWDVCIIATPSALKFMDIENIEKITGHRVRFDYKQPGEPDVLPPANAFVVAPATFNTINKMVVGASDTLALGMLNEAIGVPLPIIAVPTPNLALARHPAFQASISTLRAWGVKVIFDPELYPLPTPNMGPPAADLFPWDALASAVSSLRDSL